MTTNEKKSIDILNSLAGMTDSEYSRAKAGLLEFAASKEPAFKTWTNSLLDLADKKRSHSR